MLVVNELLPPTLQLFSKSALYNQGKKLQLIVQWHWLQSVCVEKLSFQWFNFLDILRTDHALEPWYLESVACRRSDSDLYNIQYKTISFCSPKLNSIIQGLSEVDQLANRMKNQSNKSKWRTYTLLILL